VTAEVQAETSIRRHVGQLGRVDESDLEPLRREDERLSGNVGVIAMRVIRAGEVNPRGAPPDAPHLIDQHRDPQVLERLHHVGAIMVAQDRVDPVPGRYA
jgi:hypothetical protein